MGETPEEGLEGIERGVIGTKWVRVKPKSIQGYPRHWVEGVVIINGEKIQRERKMRLKGGGVCRVRVLY
jgi:hypothetical protein